MPQNGFESWPLLRKRFSLPGTAQNVSLLTRVLEFKFRTENSEQDFSEWEMLKNKCERQTKTELPDSILVATLLNKTASPLQQHFRRNVRTLDTYETVRRVIMEYYQNRHVTALNKTSDPAPMYIGAMWRKGKGKGKKGSGKWPPPERKR